MFYVPQEVREYLRTICSDVQVTKGEYDEESHFPDVKLVTIGAFKIGVCHGHQVRADVLLNRQAVIHSHYSCCGTYGCKYIVFNCHALSDNKIFISFTRTVFP